MKLLRCHIENFGVLSNFDFEFQEGLTVIHEANGFGKTTFTVFIKVMFYGMPRRGARNIVENERKRYYPWQGGKYGGFLEFEYKGVSYRVTRYFGKTAAKDTFDLFDLTNHQKSSKFSDKLGEELFQLDEESFMRSIYMPQISGNVVSATTSIRTKLSDLVDNTNDLNNYDTAVNALRQVRTNYKSYRGNSGEIQDLLNDYMELDADKYKAEEQKPLLENIVVEIDKLNAKKQQKNKDISNIREKIRFFSEQKNLLMLKNRWQELKSDVTKNQESLNELDCKYSNGYPEIDEIKTQRRNVGMIEQIDKRLESLQINEEKFNKLKDFFKEGIPQEDMFKDCKQKQHECEILMKSREKYIFSDKEQEEYQSLSDKFCSGVPTQQEIQNNQQNCRRIVELSSTPKVSPYMGIFSLILFILGIICFAIKSSLFGFAFIGSSFIVMFYLQMRKNIDNPKICDLQNCVKQFLMQFYTDATEPEDKLIQLLFDSRRYKELQEKKLLNEEKLKDIDSEIKKKEDALYAVFNTYYPELSYKENFIDELETNYHCYKTLQEIMNEHTEILNQKERINENIQMFLDKYKLVGNSINEILEDLEDDINNCSVYEKSLNQSIEKLQRFLDENPEIEQQKIKNIEEFKSLEELQSLEKAVQHDMDTIDSQLWQLRQKRDSLRKEVERISKLDDKMADLKEQKEEAEKKCMLLDRTMDLLDQAKDNLANSYVNKVESSFINYAKLLLDTESNHILIDKDLNVYVDEYGASREIKSFSMGVIDRIMICMRLALVDTLFKEEKPFLIFDDPFVNLDDEHTKKVLSILNKIAKNKQIVYLVCNSSRC